MLSSFWEAKEGKNGIAQLQNLIKDLDVYVAAEVKDFDATKYMDRKEQNNMDLFCQYGLAATIQAVEETRYYSENTDYDRFGVMVGSQVSGGLTVMESQIIKMHDKGPTYV